MEELDLSVRTYNGLRRAGIENLTQLLKMSVEDILAIGTIGPKSQHELFVALINHSRVARGKRLVKLSWTPGQE